MNVELVWEEIRDNDSTCTKRTKVIGGWLVQMYWQGCGGMVSVVFVPDEYHSWCEGNEKGGT